MDIEVRLIKHEGLEGVDPEELAKIKDIIGPEGHGLLHPITVQNHPDGIHFNLVTGKVRLRAFIELGIKCIPCKLVDKTLTKEQCLDIALSENLRRHNLQWYEQIELEQSLHELRLRQNGKVAIGRPIDGKVGWSQADTARELGISVGAFSQDLTLANAIKRNPHLKRVKDKKTALRLIRHAVRREELENESLIESSFEMDQVFLGDSVEILKQFPPSLFDACITDPPWSEYKDEKLTSDESTFGVFKELFRVLKGDSLLYAVVSTTDFFMYQRRLPEFGFRVQQYPLIWAKSGTITHGKRTWEYARDYEPILVAAKGNPILTIPTELSSILTFPSMHYPSMIHPHEKPIELMRTLIKHSTFEGAKIVDPFAGSGVTLEAARGLNRRYIGVERDHKFYTNIEKRLVKRILPAGDVLKEQIISG